ncbi:MAG: lysophospholipid acyltransferase family protein [Mycobacterium leprae]
MAEPTYTRANGAFRFIRGIGRGLFRALFKIRVEGLDRLPPNGGYVLTCNHIGWVDGILLLLFLPAEPRIHYLAASELTVTGPGPVRLLVKLVGGIIPVDRTSHKGDRQVVVQALKVLRGGGILGIFPEGRCGTEEGVVQPLKEGAANFALKTGSPIQVIGLSGTVELYCRKRIHIRVGPLLTERDGESQEELLSRLHAALAENIPPLDPKQPKRKYMRWLTHLI